MKPYNIKNKQYKLPQNPPSVGVKQEKKPSFFKRIKNFATKHPVLTDAVKGFGFGLGIVAVVASLVIFPPGILVIGGGLIFSATVGAILGNKLGEMDLEISIPFRKSSTAKVFSKKIPEANLMQRTNLDEGYIPDDVVPAALLSVEQSIERQEKFEDSQYFAQLEQEQNRSIFHIFSNNK